MKLIFIFALDFSDGGSVLCNQQHHIQGIDQRHDILQGLTRERSDW